MGYQTGSAATKYGYYFAPNEPTMQIAAQPAAIRWTAPGAGTVTLNVTFEAVGTGTTGYTYSEPESEIFQNATVVDPATQMKSYQATHNYTGTLTVAAGDKLDFAGLGSVPSSTWTPAVSISGTIDFVPSPEPSSIVLLVCGLAGLLAYAWRKRR